MPEQIRQVKNYFTFNKGINTEANEINFPDGFSTDERNYELLVDGSRRRRKGLALESGGSDKVTTTATGSATGLHSQSFVWTNVGGDPDKTFIVHKSGSVLYFTDDAELISTTYNSNEIDLDDYAVTTSSGAMNATPATFSAGRGYLLITGEHITPIYVKYNSSTDNFSVTPITIRVRDYQGIDDGVAISVQPATLSNDHRYNLFNRGWKQTDVPTTGGYTQYKTDKGVYPSKVMRPSTGYRRQTDVTYSDLDGIQTWSSDKIESEVFGDASAPQGALILDPMRSTFAIKAGDTAVSISTWSYVDNGSDWDITITTSAAHGIGVGETATITGMRSCVTTLFGDFEVDWSGSYTTLAGTTGSTLVINAFEPFKFTGFVTQYLQKGQVGEGQSILRSTGSTLDVGPKVCEFHDGRAFFAGLPDQEWSDYIFFSQVPDQPNQFGKCYQVADPTDPFINQMVATDGGFIVLQGVQGVQQLLSMRGALLVFANNGVWEIGGGERGFFTPDGYSVRKVTDVGCNSPYSPIRIEDTAIFTSPNGIFQIGPNPYTGILEATSISESRVQSFWNDVPETYQKRVKTVYDDAKKRVWFLYGDTAAASTSHYTNALIVDVRIPAWFRYKYRSATSTGILDAYTITKSDTTDNTNKVKFTCCVDDTLTLRTCDHNQSDYIDFDGVESPLPFVQSGHDSIDEFQLRKHAPIITVYAKRTETGYTESGFGFEPINPSSNYMSAFWDWTDDGVSGKVATAQETYRHTRAFVPSATSSGGGGSFATTAFSIDAFSDDSFFSAQSTSSITGLDGYPVVVTRNKVRGRGRVLQLRFEGSTAKDSHILGFSINYKIQSRV